MHAPVSLLQRISAKRNPDVATANVETTYPPPSRPRFGSLRVDTSSLDQPSIKQHQNKLTNPSFTAKETLSSQANEPSGGLLPAPVMAQTLEVGSLLILARSVLTAWDDTYTLAATSTVAQAGLSLRGDLAHTAEHSAAAE
jgi:hypothetical protein